MKGHAAMQRIEVKKKFGIKNLAVGSGSHEPDEAFRVLLPTETIALLIIPSETQKYANANSSPKLNVDNICTYINLKADKIALSLSSLNILRLAEPEEASRKEV